MIARVTGQFISVVKNLLARVASIPDQGIREQYTETLKKLGEILERHATDENNIAMDTRLSETGKDAKVAELATATLKQLGFLPQKAVDADNARGRLKALIFAVPDAPKGVNEIIQYLREAEIRTHLRSLPPSDRIAPYLEAMHADESPEANEVIRAIRLAPGEALIPEEVRQRAERDRAEAIKPRELVKLRSLEAVAEALEMLAEQVLTWLKSYRAELPVSPKQRITSGQYLVGYSDEIKIPLPKAVKA